MYFLVLNDVLLLQKVSSLPHQRYDQFMECIQDFKEMLSALEIRSCPCSTFRDLTVSGSYVINEENVKEAQAVCSWPTLHSDIATLKETGRVVHVMHGQLVADPIKDTRVGKASREAIKLLNEDDIIK